MAGSKSYNELLNKYNMLVQRARDLNNNLKDKIEENKKLEGATKHTEKLARELCESILAKESSEMRLGKEYSWSKIPIDELINKAHKSYKNYTKTMVEQYEELLDKNEALYREKQDKQDQIEKMMSTGSIQYSSQEEIEKAVEEEKKAEAAREKMSHKAKQVAGKGNLHIIDDNVEVDDTEEKLFEDVMDMNLNATPMPTSKSKQTKKRNEQIRRQTKPISHQVNINELIADLSDLGKEVIHVIGTEGVCKYQDIRNKIPPTNTDTSIRTQLKQLSTATILHHDKVKTPTAILAVYYFKDLGKRLFETLFPDEELKPNEAEIIIAEHDNLNHGYGILHVAEELRKKGIFKEVKDMNRKQPIKVGGEKYIPDIICIMDNTTMYIEYEMGTHNTAEFNSKLNKMMMVTPIINIVCPKKPTLKELEKKVSRWVKSRGADSLKKVTVRLATVATIKEMSNPRKNEEWDVLFKPAKSGENPIYAKGG